MPPYPEINFAQVVDVLTLVDVMNVDDTSKYNKSAPEIAPVLTKLLQLPYDTGSFTNSKK